jgi:hypothetical protein
MPSKTRIVAAIPCGSPNQTGSKHHERHVTHCTNGEFWSGKRDSNSRPQPWQRRVRQVQVCLPVRWQLLPIFSIISDAWPR